MKKKMDKEQAKRHHPYCVFTHDNKLQGWSWTCECKILKAFDKWRKNNEEITPK